MTDLVIQYLAEPGTKRPELDALFTSRFTGNIKLDEVQWAKVRARVAEYDKVFT
jgi:hypothetical protein